MTKELEKKVNELITERNKLLGRVVELEWMTKDAPFFKRVKYFLMGYDKREV